MAVQGQSIPSHRASAFVCVCVVVLVVVMVPATGQKRAPSSPWTRILLLHTVNLLGVARSTPKPDLRGPPLPKSLRQPRCPGSADVWCDYIRLTIVGCSGCVSKGRSQRGRDQRSSLSFEIECPGVVGSLPPPLRGDVSPGGKVAYAEFRGRVGLKSLKTN